ncbi:hypothetical protein DRE_06469 [Drechslerella stenobrocha 248]|uniref:Mso1 N-terminal domain-containing protein n=1 Tax=Drechslerella stenobrocha 248 TaxID=1043628 RepID=W7HLE8_9PEZI|nr:hypothetical protein DRE_06469 [Drechslerella stenobrocha 248]
MSGLFSNLNIGGWKAKVANISLPSFSDNSDADHGENEDESAVSRALREYYKERDGFVPEWLSTITTATAPPKPHIDGGQAGMLGDIFSGNASRATPPPPQPQQMRRGSTKPQSVSPVYPQHHQPPPGPASQPQLQPQPQAQPQQQMPPPQPQQPQRAPVGLPSGPRGGVKPFMALKREQQQRQAQTAPPQQYHQPPPLPGPPRGESYSGVPSQHPPSNARQPPPPPAGGGRSRFAAAAGEPGGRSSAPPAHTAPAPRAAPSTDRPFVSATAPWANSADDEFGYYGR